MNSNDTVNNQRQNNLIYNDFNNKILEDDYQDMIKYEYELGEDYFFKTRSNNQNGTSKQKEQN